MFKKKLAGSTILAALAFGSWGATTDRAEAQSAPPADESSDTIVVTGSFIRGTPEDAALPVNVITAEELERQGSPSTVELIKRISASSGVQGDTNQFDTRAQGAEGSGTVNLRGLGPERTLVLLNGRRLALNPFGLVGSTVDTNKIPSAAIGRIEVLKDGAAATYGSDAVAGVVNFITKQDFTGVEVSGDYRLIDGSDGNWTTSVNVGWAGQQAQFFLSAGFQHKSELRALERDWAIRPYLENPQGGWSSFGNPSVYVPLSAGGTPLAGVTRDPQCNAVGAFAGFTGTTPACYFNFVRFDNLAEEEDRYQVFSSFDLDINANHRVHFEALYTNTIVPNWLTSPAYITLQTPTAQAGGIPGQYVVPATNPFFQDFVAKNPGVFPAGTASVLLPLHRPLGWGGNPLFPENNFASEGKRAWEAYRVSAGINGEWDNGIGYDLSATYMQDRGTRTGYDILVNRFQRALLGFGGFNCTGTVAGANGCLWWNPFSTRIDTNKITGVTNPQYNAATAGNTEILRWMYAQQKTEQTSSLLTVDAVFNGELPIQLGDGNIGWAFGGQLRSSGFITKFNEFSDLSVNPCVATPDFGVTNCAAQTGPLIFLGGSFPANISRDVHAVFAEFNLPFTESFNAQLAARYEDYGGETGSTFNPKVAASWEVADWLKLRGSAGSTFRGPSLANTQSGSVTGFNFVLGAFRAIDIFGNPSLKPEKADTYNLGAIVSAGGFKGSVDFWQFNFTDQIIAEPTEAIANTMFPGGSTVNCGNPAFAALQSRFTFSAAGCAGAPGAISRIRTTVTNGPDVETSGLDVAGQYTFDDFAGGELTFGIDATYTLKYAVGSFVVEGRTVQSAFDATNKLNAGLSQYPLPKFKGTASITFDRGPHTLRYGMNFVDDYTDQRTAPFAPSQSNSTTLGVLGTIPGGKVIDQQITHDLTYRAELPSDARFLFSIENVTDEDPAFARLDLSYDPFTGNPLGRTYKIGLTKRF